MILEAPKTCDRIRKVWGWTTEVVHGPEWSAHFLEIEAGGYCSVHLHLDRANVFAVHSGQLDVELWFANQTSTIHLAAGDTFTVPSLVVHRFICHGGATCSEYYYPDRGGTVDRGDIVRFQEGGMGG